MSQVEARMQQAAEQRLDEIDEASWQLDENPEDDQAAQVLGLWCGGCHTCVVREVLEAAVPLLLEAIRTGEFVP